jgi:hypothetical protein
MLDVLINFTSHSRTKLFSFPLRPLRLRVMIFLAFFILLPSVWAQTADSLNSSVDRANEARKMTGDFEGSAYFPGEWETAENQYKEAGLLAKKPGDEAILAYNMAADFFEKLFELAIPLYAQAREDEIMALRGYLIDLGARNYFYEYLLEADKAALLAFSLFEEKNYYSARDSAAFALRKFSVLDTAFNAWLLRVELKERGFQGYEPESFEIGDETIIEAMDAYMKDDLQTAQVKAEKALSMYNMALSNAWVNYAELRSSLAEGERLAALDMKTNIAAKEFFGMADTENKTALDLMEAKQYEDAAKLFIDAEALFVIASMSTLEKRRTAATAIKNANEKIQESEKLARNVVLFIEGVSK